MGTVSRRRLTHHGGAIPRFDVSIARPLAEIMEHPLGEGAAADRHAFAPLRLSGYRTLQRRIDPLAMHRREPLHVNLQRRRLRRLYAWPVQLSRSCMLAATSPRPWSRTTRCT